MNISRILKNNSYLFLHLPFVNVDLLRGLLERVLEQYDVLLILFALNHNLLKGAFLLAQNFDRLGVSPLLLVDF